MPPTWRAWKAQNGSKRWYFRYPLVVEWALEWFVYRLRSLALFDLLELAGRCTVLVIAIFWVLEADDRTKERHYRAWELINSARGSTGDGGRTDALQDLNRDRVSLAAAPLEQAFLPWVDLADAILAEANLQGANLMRANLAGANLAGANLQSANLAGAYLQGADFADANLQEARITQEQLDAAEGDDKTVLPEGLTRPAHWSKAKGSESPPAAQPDDAWRAPPASGASGSDK